jgi:hypothetical protein
VKICILTLVVYLFILSRSFGAEVNSSNDFYLGLGSGFDLPGTTWVTKYNIGYSNDFLLGYKMDETWNFQLELEQVVFTGQILNHNDYRELIEIKFVFDGPSWQPYLLIGSNWLTLVGAFVSGSSSPNFNAVGGVGVQFDLWPKVHFFVEGKYNYSLNINQNISFSDVPVLGGLLVGF